MFSNNTVSIIKCFYPILFFMKTSFIILALFTTGLLHGQLPTEFFKGRTTGILPFLKYGLGEDRLGGTKLTYLDTGIVLKVVDSIRNDYKVQLSQGHFAYLPKRYFVRNDSIPTKPMHLTASARVYGDEQFDYVTLQLDERLPYRSMQQVNSSKIIVDVFGVTTNTNWITQLKSAKTIKNFYYEQLEDDVFRMTIELNNDQHWGYSINYNRNTLIVKVKRPPAKLKAKDLVIVLDAGHGGAHIGAKGLSGIQEKDYTLLITKEIEKYLRKKNVSVHMTRTEDSTMEMPERINTAKQVNPDLLLSIHLNSSSNKTVKGVSTYYRHIGFKPVSTFILDRMLDLDLNNFGNIGSFNFSLNGPTDYNNCLLEVAFLSNADDEKRIMDPDFHKKVAKQVYKGLKDWMKSIR